VKLAVTTYRKALAINENFDRLHHNLGEALMSQGNYKEAIKHYNRALELNPDNTRTFNNLAWAFAQMGENIDDALALSNAALEQNQNNGFYYDTLGWIYYKQGMFDEAYQALAKAIEFSPGIPEIHFHMGETLRWQGKHREATEEYGRVMGLEPYGQWADKAQKAIWSIKGL
jgi:tetratricopeptide (TPR) repeat protein